MEITATQTRHYSFDLNRTLTRELADHLYVDVRELNRLVKSGQLYDEYATELLAWMETNQAKAECTSIDEFEIEEITG